MKKRDVSLLINLLIIVFEIVGLISNYLYNSRIDIEFYTEDSNILLLICSTLFVYYLIKRKSIPKWLHIFKYLATVCVTITFIVVLFILAPIYNFNYGLLLFGNTMLFHHTICHYTYLSPQGPFSNHPWIP